MSNRATKRQPNNDRYHSFLESLKGKTVKVYRGGPESKQGVLLDVQSDFVTVYAQNNNDNDNNNNNNGDNNKNNNQSKNQSNDKNNQNNDNNNQNNVVVYYHTKHVKSISEDSKSNSSQIIQSDDSEIEFIQATEFTEVIAQLKEKYIQINQGGPESKNGLVLDVVDDYIILYTQDDGIVYFNVDHVKSVYEYSQNNQNSGENQQGNANNNTSQAVIPKYETAGNFHDIFGHMSHKWVAINRGGPEAMEGVLVESTGGHYTLVSNEEVLRINPYHIRSISSGSKGSASQNQNNNQDQNQNNEQNQNSTEETTGESKNSKSNDNEAGTGKRSRRMARETVVKTIDYKWNPKY